MALKNVRKDIVEKQIKSLTQTSASKALEGTAQKHYRMGNDYFSEKNYALSCYSYYLSLQDYASIIVSRKVKEPVESDEAVEYLVKRKELGLEDFKVLKQLAVDASNRKHLERKDCVKAKEIVAKLRREAR